MHRFFLSIFRLFLSPGGIMLLGALDSTMGFFLPVAIDAGVIIMSARWRNWWLFALLAAAGSIAGLTVTFLMGSRIGEAGLKRWIAPGKLLKLRSRMGDSGVLALSAAAVMPPPFPLSPIVLAGGAVGVDRRKFLSSLAVMRLVRFSAEGILAVIYGRHILRWIESVVFEYAISALMILAFIGTGITVVKGVRSRR
jgi:membrane protein YqaA with SNARE-associated domain